MPGAAGESSQKMQMENKVETSVKPREKLTRERIIDAALRIMDVEGLEGVTMRRVARELGVEAMSLYNHVDDKEALFDGICERVMSGFQIPPGNTDWVEEARQLARSFRAALRAHPNVITLISGQKHPLMSVDALRPMDCALECLSRSGLPDHEVAQVYRTFGGYIFGYVLMEVGQTISGPAGYDGAMPQVDDLAAGPAGEQLPAFVRLLPELAQCDPDADFEFGLGLLLGGLQALAGGPAEVGSSSDQA